ECSEVVAAAALELKRDSHNAFPDEEQLITGIAHAKDRFAGVERARFGANAKQFQAVFVDAVQQIYLFQVKRVLFSGYRNIRILKDAVFCPLQSIVECLEDFGRSAWRDE